MLIFAGASGLSSRKMCRISGLIYSSTLAFISASEIVLALRHWDTCIVAISIS